MGGGGAGEDGMEEEGGEEKGNKGQVDELSVREMRKGFHGCYYQTTKI